MRPTEPIWRALIALIGLTLWSSAMAQDTADEVEGFPTEQIDQLLAPIALYPDALLAQVLVASTYPLDIVQASRWVEDNSELEEAALQEAVVEEPWDPSVQALAFFPTVLTDMNENLGWTQDLGEAFLGQQEEVMDSVQTLRTQAHEAGNLESNERHQVQIVEETIVVQPADPEVVYVPTYDSSQVYAQPPPAQTYYPNTYTEPESSSDNSGLINFGIGAIAGGLLTAAIMWDDDDDYRGVYYGGPGYWGGPSYWSGPNYWNGGWRNPPEINRNRNVNIETGDINVNKGIGNAGRWEHNTEHRGNIRYKNEKTKAKYADRQPDRAVDRDAARGRTPDLSRKERDPARGRTPDLAGKDRSQAKAPSAAKRQPTKTAKPAKKREVDLKRPKTSTPRTPAKKASGTGQTASPQTPRRQAAPRTGQTGGGTFKKSDAKLDRAASKRGSKSVKKSGHTARGGGGHGRRSRG